MPTVTINGVDYPVYGDVAAADAYLGGSTTAAAWRVAATDDKARALVSAARWIDSLSWQGSPTAADQELAWPRGGIPDLDSGAVPDAVVDASFELAASLVADADFRTTFQSVATKSLKAGSVQIEYFRGASVQAMTPFPSSVMAMIGKWLAGNGDAAVGAIAFGTCEKSDLDRPFTFDRGL